MAPTVPKAMFGSPYARFFAGMTPETGGAMGPGVADAVGAAGGGGGTGTVRTAGEVLAASICRAYSFAASVPSKAQFGHCTGAGIWPFTGSTSKLYFVPHEQRIFTSMVLIGLGGV